MSYLFMVSPDVVGIRYEYFVVYMKGLSLVGKVKSHSEGRRRSVEVGTRLGAGVEAEGVVAVVSKLRSLVDRRHSRRG